MHAQLAYELSAPDWRSPSNLCSEVFERFSPPNKTPTSSPNASTSSRRCTDYLSNHSWVYHVLHHPTSIFVVGCIIIVSVYARSASPLLINNVRITCPQSFRAVFFCCILLFIVSDVLKSASLSVIGSRTPSQPQSQPRIEPHEERKSIIRLPSSSSLTSSLPLTHVSWVCLF